MKSFWGKVGKGLLRFLLRHWAPLLIVVFGLLGALTVVQVRRAGVVSTLAIVPKVLVYVGLIVLVILVRYVLARWVAGLFARGKDALRKQVTQQVIDQGKGRAGALWGRGVARAKGLLGDTNGTTSSEWSRAVTGWRSTPTPLASAAPADSSPAQTACPRCGRGVRPGVTFCDGCGVALKALCPKCGRELRAGAEFCDGCGKRVRSRRQARRDARGGNDDTG